MNTLEVYNELRDCPTFVGVFPRDKLPEIIRYPSSLVINTDKASDKGEHWIAVYFNENKIAEYFDSFGLPPLHPSIINYLRNYSNTIAYNATTLQNIFSFNCGWYCVSFIKLRNIGYSFCDIINIFGRNTLRNDLIAKFIAGKITCNFNGKNKFFQ